MAHPNPLSRERLKLRDVLRVRFAGTRARSLRALWLLGAALSSACSLRSLDPYFECSGPAACGASGEGTGGDRAVPTPGPGSAGAGDACMLDSECARGTCWRGVCGDELELKYEDAADSDSDPAAAKWIKFDFTLTNRSSTSRALGAIEVRYYFTPESVTPQFEVLSTTHLPKADSDVVGSFGITPNGWTYLSVGFLSDAGELGGGASTGVVKVGVHDADFGPGTFYQTDDYSFLDGSHLSVHLDGQLVSGTPPTEPPSK